MNVTGTPARTFPAASFTVAVIATREPSGPLSDALIVVFVDPATVSSFEPPATDTVPTVVVPYVIVAVPTFEVAPMLLLTPL